jgi:hypothetical protein
MQKIFQLSLLAALVFFTSCFEIVEQVFVKADGSGNMQLTLNLSKSKTKINSLRQMKVVNGHAVPSESEIKRKIKEIENSVSKTQGLTDVKTTLDLNNYIATITCNFSKVNQLNGIVKNIAADNGGNNTYVEKSYDYNTATNIFERLNKVSFKKDYNKMSNADKEIFATANYTSIYKFENNISKASNTNSKISPSKKAIMLQCNVLDVITEKKSITNKIALSK